MNKISVLEMSHKQAKSFLLKPTSYCNFNLPPYFNLGKILETSKGFLTAKNKAIKEIKDSNLTVDGIQMSDIYGVNFTFQKNKTLNTYRPLTLMHPLVYIDLVACLTRKNNWEMIVDRLKKLRSDVETNIICKSLPFDVIKKGKNITREMALYFWNEIEQESIKQSLEFAQMLKVDISNCYGSIYTHTIAWAVMGEEEAKNKRNNKSELGNILDKKFQQMNYAETVGIPQGNVVSDLIAEILLAYIDSVLYDKLKKHKINYKILRYRDDYRIFANSESELQIIKKELVSVLQRFKLTIGEHKTIQSNSVVLSSVSEDKLYWIEHDPVIKITPDLIYQNLRKLYSILLSGDVDNRIYSTTLQKHLMIIKIFSDNYPNSGQLIVALNEFERRISNMKNVEFDKVGIDLDVICSIVSDILLQNPKITETGVKLLSQILVMYPTMDENKKVDLVKKLNTKISNSSYNDFLEVWIQRLIVKDMLKVNTQAILMSLEYNSKLTRLVQQVVYDLDDIIPIFNEDWLQEDYRVNLKELIDINIIEELNQLITEDEMNCSDNHSLSN
jgi:hypothetical protein